jgi:hypothetical protein
MGIHVGSDCNFVETYKANLEYLKQTFLTPVVTLCQLFYLCNDYLLTHNLLQQITGISCCSPYHLTHTCVQQKNLDKTTFNHLTRKL